MDLKLDLKDNDSQKPAGAVPARWLPHVSISANFDPTVQTFDFCAISNSAIHSRRRSPLREQPCFFDAQSERKPALKVIGT